MTGTGIPTAGIGVDTQDPKEFNRELIDAYLEDARLQGLTPKTRVDYESNLRILSAFLSKPVVKLTNADLKACVEYDIRTMKVGKVNTFLIVPTDYSTVYNGSGGAHRYVGEQRFIFFEINITGGGSNNWASGLNQIIVPRGVFYRSKAYDLLNGTYADLLGTYLENALIMGNDNTNFSALNAKVIQMIISNNLTTYQANELLWDLRHNSTGVSIATYIFVTSEMYTIGFAEEVLELSPTTVVFNSGNHSAPEPPVEEPSFWELAWNTMVGVANYVWDAAVAVATYMENLIEQAQSG